MREREFDAVVGLARESLLGRLVTGAVHGWRTAWSSSRFVGAGRRLQSTVAAWPEDTRLRFGALTVAWAGIGYAVSVLVLPRYTVSGLPVTWAGTIVLAAFVVAAAPRAFLAAWRGRRAGQQVKEGGTH